MSDLDSETLLIPGGIHTIRPADLGAPRAESPDDDYDMRDASDTREGRGGKVVKCKGKFIEVLASYRNIAPIVDAVLADPDESGQVSLALLLVGLIAHHSLASNRNVFGRCKHWLVECRPDRSRLPGAGSSQRDTQRDKHLAD